MPDVLRPAPDEQTPRRPRAKKPADPPRAAAAKPAAPPRAVTSGTTDAVLRQRLIEMYEDLGFMTAGIGYIRQSPGMALGGINIKVSAAEQADADLQLCKSNPKLRAMLVRFLDQTALAAWIGAKVTLMAPILAALVPHPMFAGIANSAIKPEAHTEAIETMPELFGFTRVQDPQTGEWSIRPMAQPMPPTDGAPVVNSTDGAL